MSTLLLLEEVMERQFRRKQALAVDPLLSLPVEQYDPTIPSQVGLYTMRVLYAQREWEMREDDDISKRDFHLMRQIVVLDELIEMTEMLTSSRVHCMLLDLKAENMAILGIKKKETVNNT